MLRLKRSVKSVYELSDTIEQWRGTLPFLNFYVFLLIFSLSVSTLSIFFLFLFISSLSFSLLCLLCLWQCTFVNMSTFADQNILHFDIIDQDITILDILIKVPPLLLCVVTTWSVLVPSWSTAPDHICIIFTYLYLYLFILYLFVIFGRICSLRLPVGQPHLISLLAKAVLRQIITNWFLIVNEYKLICNKWLQFVLRQLSIKQIDVQLFI